LPDNRLDGVLGQLLLFNGQRHLNVQPMIVETDPLEDFDESGTQGLFLQMKLAKRGMI